MKHFYWTRTKDFFYLHSGISLYNVVSKNNAEVAGVAEVGSSRQKGLKRYWIVYIQKMTPKRSQKRFDLFTYNE